MWVKVLKPICGAETGYLQKGAVADLSEDTVNAFGEEFLVKTGKPTPEVEEKVEEVEEVEEEVVDLENLSVAKLKEIAKAKDLPTAGTKTDILERIQLSETEEVEETETVEEPEV